MAESTPPILLVVCNDYGELALAMYLLEGQPLAQKTTLMLPPLLYASNAEILPERTLVYHSVADIQQEMRSRTSGILGLVSGYLLPVHRLGTTDELISLLRWSTEENWSCFTSDPFVGLLDKDEPSELVTLTSPRWSILWKIFAAIEKRRLSHILSEMHSALREVPHVYPLSVPQSEVGHDGANRLRFHNPNLASQSGDKPRASESPQRWLFVLGDQDYTVQAGLHGQTIWTTDISRKFRKILIGKLHETLEAGRLPTLIAPRKIIEAVQKHSPVADAIDLIPHCSYSQFFSLLRDAEYVFYWNATSFSCILRTLLGKPWFTFDSGHLLRGMNADYAARVFESFYQDCEPPRLPSEEPLTGVDLLQATLKYHESAERIRRSLLATLNPQSLLASLAPFSESSPGNQV